MQIEVYLDHNTNPFQVLLPPEKFRLDTTTLQDGPHELVFKVIEDGIISSVRTVKFTVQNGPAIAVHGILEGDTLSGDIAILANAYGSRIGDEFEPVRIETPAPVPTWAWILVLMVLAWGAGYISLELHNRIDTPSIAQARSASPDQNKTITNQAASWKALGEQVYGNNCASCHQTTGLGLPGVFPPLKSNPAVLDENPDDHISAVLNGLSGKAIDGVSYAAPMPPFGSVLSDEEVAAVINHERTQWNNNAPLITPEDVTQRRQGN